MKSSRMIFWKKGNKKEKNMPNIQALSITDMCLHALKKKSHTTKELITLISKNNPAWRKNDSSNKLSKVIKRLEKRGHKIGRIREKLSTGRYNTTYSLNKHKQEFSDYKQIILACLSKRSMTTREIVAKIIKLRPVCAKFIRTNTERAIRLQVYQVTARLREAGYITSDLGTKKGLNQIRVLIHSLTKKHIKTVKAASKNILAEINKKDKSLVGKLQSIGKDLKRLQKEVEKALATLVNL